MDTPNAYLCTQLLFQHDPVTPARPSRGCMIIRDRAATGTHSSDPDRAHSHRWL